VIKYERKGECNRCGSCCQNEDCEHFDSEGEKTTCKIFGSTDRLLKCSLFPELPPILFEKCGYYFLDKWENNRKVELGKV